MKRTTATLMLAAALALAGCASGAEPSPTVTVTETVEAPAPTVTVTVEPEAAAGAQTDVGASLAALQSVSSSVVGLDESEPGRWNVATNLTDPRSDGSEAAATAHAICEEAVRLGATYVSVAEGDGTAFVLYGHPSYGDVCIEV